MKKALPFVLVVLIALYYSCTKDHTSLPVITPNACAADSVGNTYNLRIKGIMDDNCAYAPCHDAAHATRNMGVDLSSYSGTVDAFTNKNALCAIKNAGCEFMPQGGTKLDDSTIAHLDCWQQAGYPQ